MPIEDPVPRILQIIKNIQQYPEILVYLKERAKEVRTRLKTADEMVEDHIKIYHSLI